MAGGFADVFKNCDTLQNDDENNSSGIDERNENGKIKCNPGDRSDFSDFSGGGVNLGMSLKILPLPL